MESSPSEKPVGHKSKLQVYAESPVFIRGSKGMDKTRRHGGRVLNARNPSAMSATYLHSHEALENDDFWLKSSSKRRGADAHSASK